MDVYVYNWGFAIPFKKEDKNISDCGIPRPDVMVTFRGIITVLSSADVSCTALCCPCAVRSVFGDVCVTFSVSMRCLDTFNVRCFRAVYPVSPLHPHALSDSALLFDRLQYSPIALICHAIMHQRQFQKTPFRRLFASYN